MLYAERLLRNNLLLKLSPLDISQQSKGEIVSLTQQSVSIICKKSKLGLPLCEKRKGLLPRLNATQLVTLTTFLENGSISYGFVGDYWTHKRVKYVIEEEFGVVYHHKQAGRILAKLNWTRQKPQLKDAKQDLEKVAKWKEEDLPLLKKKP